MSEHSRPVPPEGPDTCLHCAIGELQHERFNDQPLDLSISQLLELISDWIADLPLNDQLKVFEFAERILMTNRNAVLQQRWKVGS